MQWHPADCAAYRTLRLEALASAPTAFAADHAEEAARPDADFAAALAESLVLAAIAANGGARGMVGVRFEPWRKRRHLGHVWGVYVRADSRGAGVGRALLAAGIAQARGRVDRLWLGVSVGNAPAVALYEALGFRIFGTEPAALRVDGVDLDEHLMTLDLRDPT